MEKYVKIAEKYLAVNSKHLAKGLCFTIKKSELDASNDPEDLIKNRVNAIHYDFSAVRGYTDEYGIQHLLFYNS